MDSIKHYERLKQRFLAEGPRAEHFNSSFNALTMHGIKGEEISVEISFNQFEINNKPLLIQVVKDVTLQVNVQQELSRAKDEAEALAKARSRFVATISHEIRTPMNGILGMAELLDDTPLTDTQNRYLDAIKRSGKTLLQIINEVLDFAKLDEGHVKLVEEAFDLHALIDESIDLVSVPAKDKGLKLSINYDRKLGDEFVGDALRIKQLLMNLLSNAVKFTEMGGVSVNVSAFYNDANEYQGVCLRIQDTGIGIAKENQAKLFDSFTQADDSTSRRFGGTGLGLAITKQLVELMGGTISLHSEYGEGTEFAIVLPLSRLDYAQSNPAKESHEIGNSFGNESFQLHAVNRPILHGKTVLVVEDNDINQNVIEAFLNRLGATVDMAENGLEALDFWRIHPHRYDLIIMDCHMPMMDGYEATKIIRHEEALLSNEPVPILALSANVIAEDIRRSHEAGMNDFMAKPINGVEFEEMIAKWVK